MDENQSTNTTQSASGNSKKWIIIAVAVIVIVVAAAAGGFFFLNSNSSNSESDAMMEGENSGDDAMMESDIDSSDAMQEDDGAMMMEGDETSYTDGTYTAIGTYNYHSGSESIEVTLTLESGIITSSDVVSQAVAPTSKQIQADFIANYESEVVGKNIDEVELGKVSGSSLTPLGFNAAVEDIKAQAQS